MNKKVLSLCALILVICLGFLPMVQGNEKPAFMDEIKLFAKAINALMEGYVENVNPREMLYQAMKGMLQGLGDKYSEFIDPKRFELLKIHVHGAYAGIGIQMAMVDGVATVQGLEPGGSAEKGGVLVGDKIIKVDGVEVAEKSLEEIAAMIRGELETGVALALMRGTKMIEVALQREKIEVPAIKDEKMIGKRLGYFRIVNWQENTTQQVDKALSSLKKKGMKALIIDLRNNSGGVLPAAVDLAERFLPKGAKIVSVQSKIEAQRKEHVSSGEHALPDIKLVVLVNELSASASEVFSAAMQDNKRGTIVGMKTYGKASVQSVIPLDDVSGMKLTTARYLGPSGRVIDGVGITPDVEIQNVANAPGQASRQILAAVEFLKEYK